MKLLDIPINIRVRIHDIVYMQSQQTPEIGDRILDLQDGCHGICDFIYKGGKHIAVRDEGGYSVEVGVPISRVRKLIPVKQSKNENIHSLGYLNHALFGLPYIV